MDQQTFQALTELNRAVIQFRGMYSQWSGAHDVSYNEMLVFYTIREKGFCTQKQLSDSYLLPRQTVNHVITALRQDGILEISPQRCTGREKAFRFTEKGEAWAAPLIKAMNRFETQAIELMGRDKFADLVRLMIEYNVALTQATKNAR